jgi:hypothetical protein
MKPWLKQILYLLVFLIIGIVVSLVFGAIYCKINGGGDFCLAPLGFAYYWVAFSFFILILMAFKVQVTIKNALIAMLLGLIILVGLFAFISSISSQYPPMGSSEIPESLPCPPNYTTAQCIAFNHYPGDQTGFCGLTNECPLEYTQEECIAFEDGKKQKTEACIGEYWKSVANYKKEITLTQGLFGLLLIIISLFIPQTFGLALFLPGTFLAPSLSTFATILIIGKYSPVISPFSTIHIIISIIIIGLSFFLFIKFKKKAK